MEIDAVKALILVLQIGFVTAFALRAAVGERQRLLLFCFLGGYLVYSAIGTTYQEVPWYLLWASFGLALASVAGFAFGKTVFAGVGRVVAEKSNLAFDRMNTGRFATYVIALVIALKLFKLVYPELRLNLLLAPPMPDIGLWFGARFSNDVDAVQKIVGYIDILSTPFFYIALYFIRRRLILLAATIFIVRYVEYVDAAYIARGTAISDLLIMFLAVWYEKPKLRVAMVISSLVALPMLLYFLAQYSAVRMGGMYTGDGIFGGATDTIVAETTFMLQGGLAVIDSGQTIDMPSYLLWIVTLPIPEFVKGSLPVALVNYEISTLIIGKRPGDYGFTVTLTGLLTESFYIFGPMFFWLHGLFCGFIAGALARLVEGTRCYQILTIYLAMVLLHNLNRGGIASTLSEITNGFLAFYLFLLVYPGARRIRQVARA